MYTGMGGIMGRGLGAPVGMRMGVGMGGLGGAGGMVGGGMGQMVGLGHSGDSQTMTVDPPTMGDSGETERHSLCVRACVRKIDDVSSRGATVECLKCGAEADQVCRSADREGHC